VENFYNRVDNIDDLIGSVKLPYLAWKVLFLVDKKTDSDKIAGLLETDESEVKSSLDLLVQNGLVSAEATGEPEKGEKIEAAEPEAEVEEPSAVEEESVEEEESEEISASDVIEESIVEEEEIEDEIVEEVDEEEPQEEEEPEVEETAEEEQVEEETDETDEDMIEAALDEGEEEIELLQETEDDTIQEQVTDSEEEEKIEINIPEGEEEEITDESEFNFNLTGEEAAEETVQEQAAAAEPEKEMDTSGFKKILVIDDSLVIRKMVEIALEEEEFNIHTAVSGKEGLDIMDKTNPDLVILDMMLPDINGIEILKTIKASKGVPVIMLSGKDSPQMIETAKNEGAEEFLPKPFKDDDLVEKIKKLI